jgi:pimeloyl-ACP methyl ester carboxylesterase
MEKKCMQKVTSKDGTKIAFDQAGKGPAIILIGGVLQHRADHLFSRLVPALDGHFTVISYDRRGRGDSGDTLPYAAVREMEDLDALITFIGEPVLLFGMSSGGALALQTAGKRLEIKKLALYEPPFVGGDPDYAKKLKQLLTAKRDSEAGQAFHEACRNAPLTYSRTETNADVGTA